MRYRVKEPKLATVHKLPVSARFKRSGSLLGMTHVDLRETRESITTTVYQLADAWGYMVAVEAEQGVAHVYAMTEPLYSLKSERGFTRSLFARNLPTVVECLMIAAKQAPQR